jgi:CO dehydrogenase/acetyl-CoA synthase beta subunit
VSAGSANLLEFVGCLNDFCVLNNPFCSCQCFRFVFFYLKLAI